MKLGNIERTTRDAVTTPDTVLLLEIDDPVFVLDDCSISRAGTQTSGIFAVHALVLAQQPHQVAVALVLSELDQVVVVPLSRGHRLISVVEGRFAKRMIVPLNTRDFAGFAPDARRDVDVLAYLIFTTCS